MTTTPVTLKRAIDMSDEVTVNDYKIGGFDRQEKGRVFLECRNQELKFELDVSQTIQLDEKGHAQALDLEGETLNLTFQTLQPLCLEEKTKAEVLCRKPSAEDTLVSYSIDGGDTWVAAFSDTRICFEDVDPHDESEKKDLNMTVTSEGIVLDLVGQESGDVHKTGWLSTEYLMGLLDPPWSGLLEQQCHSVPRLIAEINLTQDSLIVKQLGEAMDLSESKVTELFERARQASETNKERNL